MTSLTKKELDKSLESFGRIVKSESKAGTMEAIQDHEKNCHDRNKEFFVTEEQCADRRSDCKKGVYKKIDTVMVSHLNNTRKNSRKNIKKNSAVEEDPTIKITFSNHLKNNKATYGIGGVAVAEGIVLIIGLILKYWPF